YVVKYQLVRALTIVEGGQFHRIARVLNLHKLCSFYYPSIPHVEARDDPRGQHTTHRPGGKVLGKGSGQRGTVHRAGSGQGKRASDRCSAPVASHRHSLAKLLNIRSPTR